jgi:hypothetical protein
MNTGTTTQGAQSYDEIYQAEMARLDAEAAAANGATTPGAASTTSTTEPAPNAEPAPAAAVAADPAPGATTGEPKPETLEERFARLEREHEGTKKALNDTKAWASRSAAEVKRLKKEQEERDRRANRPQVLDDNPGLEEAVRYVTGAPAAGKPAHDPDAWADAVGTALPGLDALLEQNPELTAKAQAKAKELGEAWSDPLVAIRELSALQIEHERTRVAAAAREAAARDFENRKKQQTAMTVPGGGASRQAPPVDAAKRYETMSSADFEKERRRVMGY